MTLLLLLLVLAVVAGVAAVAGGVITGGLDDPVDTVPARALPQGPPTAADVRALRFVPALRGYRMDQVDAAMDRLGEELDRLRNELAERDRQLSSTIRYAPEGTVLGAREAHGERPGGGAPGNSGGGTTEAPGLFGGGTAEPPGVFGGGTTEAPGVFGGDQRGASGAPGGGG